MRNLLILILLAAVVVLTYGIYRRSQLQKGGPPAVQSSGKSDGSKLDLNAMARRDPKAALQFIEQMYKDPKPEVRVKAVQALGVIKDIDKTKYLDVAVSDTDQSVRTNAIAQLAIDPKQEHLNLVLTKLQKKDLSVSEKVDLYWVLARSKDPKHRKTGTEWLVYTADAGDGPDHLKALHRLVNAGKPSSQVMDILNKKANSKNPNAMASAIALLATQKDKKTLQNLGTYAKSPAGEVRAVAVSMALRECSPDRWAILKDRLSAENDPAVLMALVTSPRMAAGEQAISFLNSALASKKLNSTLVTEAKRSLAFINRPNAVDRCTK
jgi:hypothetical protein